MVVDSEPANGTVFTCCPPFIDKLEPSDRLRYLLVNVKSCVPQNFLKTFFFNPNLLFYCVFRHNAPVSPATAKPLITRKACCIPESIAES